MIILFYINQKKVVELHRKLMGDFMGDRGKEEEESQVKHMQEMNELKEKLATEFEEKIKKYEVRELAQR